MVRATQTINSASRTTVSPVRNAIDGLASTDSDGRAELHVMLPPVPRTARPLEAELFLRLREPSGRTIERSVTLPVEVPLPRIGLKPLFRDGRVGQGTIAEFDVIHLGSSGERARLAGASGSCCDSSRDGSGTTATAIGPMSRSRSPEGGEQRHRRDIEARASLSSGRLGPVSSGDRVGHAAVQPSIVPRPVVFRGRDGRPEARDRPRQAEHNVGDVARLKIEDRYAAAFVAVLAVACWRARSRAAERRR